jgi:hypothetical protein
MGYSFLLLFFILFIVLSIAYLRHKNKFWRIQPVFHFYDVSYYFFPPGLIQKGLPERNIYCNFKNIETLTISKMENYKWDSKIVPFIRKHYLQNRENIYSPKKENILPYFLGHNMESFLSFYTVDESLLDNKTKDIIIDKKVVGIMTSRPLSITIRENEIKMNVYYVDYLCVDKRQRKKGIAPQIIQTHEYNQRHKNRKVAISLFKREGEITGIVPMCLYNTYGYNISNWSLPVSLAIPYQIIEIGVSTISMLQHFIQEKKDAFSLFAISEIGNIIELIRTGNIFCFLLVDKQKRDTEILAAFFFRKTSTFVRNNVETIPCIASLCSNRDEMDSHLYTSSFLHCLYLLQKKNSFFKYAVIEEISDNDILVDSLGTADITNPTAYFFYNFAFPTFSSQQVFILN